MIWVGKNDSLSGNRHHRIVGNCMETKKEIKTSVAHADAADFELAFKRSALVADFTTDRDYILASIQEALKSRQYADAYEFVERYDEVGAGDREFVLLANLSKKFIRIELVSQLDATPPDAYRERIALCDRIIEIMPQQEAENYRTERKRCQEVLEHHHRITERKREIEALAARAEAAGFELAFKRSVHTDDLIAERDYIIASIQEAFKSKQYADALKIIEMYREVGAGDREFLLLENLSKKFIKRNDIVIVLDATPLDAYRERIALCEKIIKLTPEDAEDYSIEIKRCQDALVGGTALALPAQRTVCNRCNAANAKAVSRKKFTPAGKFLLWSLLIITIIMFQLFVSPWPMLISLACLLIPFKFFRQYKTYLVCKSCSVNEELPRKLVFLPTTAIALPTQRTACSLCGSMNTKTVRRKHGAYLVCRSCFARLPEELPRKAIFLDATSQNVGIKLASGRVSTIIERNTSIPTKVSIVFTTIEDNQPSLFIAIVQGDSSNANLCTQLGEFVLSDIPPMPAGEPRIEVEFSIAHYIPGGGDRQTGIHSLKIQNASVISVNELNGTKKRLAQENSQKALPVQGDSRKALPQDNNRIVHL